MTALSANPARSPEQIWEETLGQLQLQMTRATFEAWLQDTRLIGADNGTWQVAVKSQAAKDWLENRLLPTIDRTLAGLAGQPVTIRFVVEEKTPVPEPAFGQVEPTIDQDVGLHHLGLGTAPAQFTPHIKTTGRKTLYHPLPHYYTEFWPEYMAARWKTAGSRAFRLRQNLLTLDQRKVTDPDFTNWTPRLETSYEDLARRIGVSRAVITGREDHCHQYELDRQEGRPRGLDCCGRHAPAGCRIKKSRRTGVWHCYFWRIGVLDVLDAEKLIATDKQGVTRAHKLSLQVWHSLPILTPFQAGHLPRCLQERHHSWLIEAAPRLGFNVQDWEETPLAVETFVDHYPDYDVARLYDGRHQLNPYK